MKSRLIIVWVVEEREVWRPNTPALCPTHKQISDSFDVLRNYADRRIVSDNIIDRLQLLAESAWI